MIKDILKLIKRILILGLPLYILMLYAALKPMSFMPIEYTMWQEEKDFTKEGRTVDTIIIGDSRAKSSIIPKEAADGIYNMAIGGCGPVEMYHAAKRFIKNGGSARRAVIIFAPYHFCDIDNWGQTMNSNYLSLPELLKVYEDAAALNETDRLSEHYFMDVISYKLRLPNKYLASIYNARLNGREAENIAKYDSVRADLGYTEFGSDEGNDDLNYETHHEVFDYSPLVRLYYFRLLKLLSEEGIEVVIEQAPVSASSSEAINDEFLKGLEDMLDEISNLYPDFTVVKELPVYDNKYFGDNNHLNHSGALKYTETFKEKYYINE